MSCRQCSILIVESEISPRVLRLQAMLEERGAETLVARNSQTAIERGRQFQFAAALINVEHRALAPLLDIPVLLYASAEAPRMVVDGLERMLAARRHSSLPDGNM
jgi:CheY-like chemotaxis protein